MTLFTALVALCAAVHAERASAAVETSPVERVITLLKNLRDQVQTEGSTEASNYDKFACFCKETDTTKVGSIESRTTEKGRLEALLLKQTADHKQLAADLASLSAQKDSDEAGLARATELRNKERATYEASHLDTSNAVSGVEDALASISGSKFVEIKAKLSTQIDLADAAGFQRAAKATSLLQAMGDVPAESYDFHSGGIVDLLKGFKTDWNAKKTALEQTEQAASDSFNAAADAKRGEIDTATTSIDTKTGELEETAEDIADNTKALTEETALLNDDKTYLKDLTEQCERKAREWDQRSSQRKDELSALKKAIEIIEGNVLANEGASSTRPTVLTQGVPSRKVAVIKSSESSEDSDNDEYSDVVFVQKTVEVQKHGTKDLRNAAITILNKKGKTLNSQVLQLAAMQMAADPFAKIKTLIQGLIERLLSESTGEANQKGWCDTEIGKAEMDRSYRHGDVERLSADIQVYEASKAKQEEKIRELKVSIFALNADHTTMTTQREDENVANKASLEAAQAGLKALKNAMEVLNDFYRKAGRATTSFVQESASPVDADMAAAGTGGFSGANKGNQAQAGGILGMLATIQSDFERSISETTSEEEQAHRDYVKFDIETKASLRSQERGQEQTENDLAVTSSKLATALTELQENQSLLDTSLRTLETLRPACVDTGMTWEDKVAKRDAEIAALKDARCKLDEEDNEYPECASTFLFLQKH